MQKTLDEEMLNFRRAKVQALTTTKLRYFDIYLLNICIDIYDLTRIKISHS